jgi:cold shock CspA family protein
MIYTGIVNWFVDTKSFEIEPEILAFLNEEGIKDRGFGFITPDEDWRDIFGEQEVFVHHSAVMTSEVSLFGYRTLEAGQRVRFSVVEAEQGIRASHVTSSLDEPGSVYLFKSGDYHKIGFSIDPDVRLVQVKSPDGGSVEEIHRIKTCNMRQVEKCWHDYFKDKRAKVKNQREWFMLSEEDIEKFKSFKDL